MFTCKQKNTKKQRSKERRPNITFPKKILARRGKKPTSYLEESRKNEERENKRLRRAKMEGTLL
jgi:hypothetical protein